MANTFSPNGFTPVRRIDGTCPSGAISSYQIIGTNTHAMYMGDPVSRLSTGYIDVVAPGSLPTQGVLGIFVGCEYLSVSQQKVVWSKSYPGSDVTSTTIITAYVVDDPNTVLRAWVGNLSASAAGGPAVQASIGQTINFQYGSPNTLSGISGAYVDFNTISTSSATLPFTIVGLVTNPPGLNGTDITTAGNMVEVSFNQQAFRAGTAGV